jgi:hypothetical protein
MPGPLPNSKPQTPNSKPRSSEPPTATTNTPAAANCIPNRTAAESGRKSSTRLTTYSATAPPKNAAASLGAMEPVIAQYSPTATSTSGMNAAPPSRGTGCVCELRSFGRSSSAFFSATKRATRTATAEVMTTEAEIASSRVATQSASKYYFPAVTGSLCS